MKAVKFIVQDEFSEKSLLQGLAYEVDSENNVIIKWKWASDNFIKMAIVFEIEHEGQSLAELLETGRIPVIITKGMEKFYKRPIKYSKKQFKVFPARFGNNGEVIILNQQANNSTGILFGKIPVYYNIYYKPALFSRFQKVHIKIDIPDTNSFIQQKKVNELIIYEKYGEGSPVLKYPFDEAALAEGITLYIKKHEKIRIKPIEQYENIIVLYKEV